MNSVECLICYEKIKNNNFCITECNYVYCLTCMIKAVLHQTECPYCKSKLLETEEDSDDEEILHISNIIEYFDNFNCTLDEHEGVYEGETKNNKMHGIGKFTFDDGYIYEGTFENGERVIEEPGKLYFPLTEEWEMYEGYFDENFDCNIEGKILYRDGVIYEGQWNSGIRHGIGKFTYSNGNIYEGNFVNDNMHGIGKMIYKNSLIKSITANWIDENKFNYKHDVKFEFDSNLLDKLIELREEIKSFDVLPNILHKYIPVLGKKTKKAELKYILMKKKNLQNSADP